MVDKKLEQHGVVGVFQEKDIAKYIIRAVKPRDLRERVEFEISTEHGKQYGRNLRMLHVLLVEKYTYRCCGEDTAARGGCKEHGVLGASSSWRMLHV